MSVEMIVSTDAMTIDAMAYAPNIFADAEMLGTATSVLGAAGGTVAGAVSAAAPPAAVYCYTIPSICPYICAKVGPH